MMASDAIGYLASALVLAAFCMKEMIPLRIAAVCSNIAFLIYGLAHGLLPVWLLHAVLLPINCWRLWQDLARPLLRRAPLPVSSIPTLAGRMLRRRQNL
jgi:CRP/FNR family transcriptional regulator, cyclic AMP receptor protein